MSGPVKRYHCEDHWESENGTFYHESDYEAVVRELAEAREKLESVTVVKDGMIRVSKELSDEVEKLRALLDGAERDVARYRWLRDVWWLGEYFDTPDPVTQANSADEFDAAIDEARIPRGGEYGRFI